MELKRATRLPESSLYRDGLLYDRLTGDYRGDLEFYLSAFQRYGGPVLELCCGTGRVALELARAGASVVGVDCSASMLDAARSKSEGMPVEWILADSSCFDRPEYRERFALAIIPYNSLGLMTDDEVRSLLSRAHAHLRADGRLVFDVPNPNRQKMLAETGTRRLLHDYVNSRGVRVRVEHRSSYDASTGVNSVVLYYSYDSARDRHVESTFVRYYDPGALSALLESGGFSIEKREAGFRGEPFSSEAKLQVVTAFRN